MLLQEHQRLSTSGARAVLPFVLSGTQYLAIPQLSRDLPDTPAHMNGGDSNTDALLYRWADGRFVESGQLPLTGGEDIAFFAIRTDAFLATAGVRAGSGPYHYNIDQVLYKWSSDHWEPFQRIPGFAAKQWHCLTIGKRIFLCLAQGVTLDHIEARNPRSSRIFEWNGSQFVDFQALEGRWGYNWESFQIDGRTFLAYADHVGDSLLLLWNGSTFAPFQTFAKKAGRCFRFFTISGRHYLAFANIQGDSTLHAWNGTAFEAVQTLSGPGGREFCIVRTAEDLFLVQINFIEGEPSAPRTHLKSRVYRWGRDRLHLEEEFPTAGGTDAATFTVAGQNYLAVSNSLTPEVRFRTDSIIYRFTP